MDASRLVVYERIGRNLEREPLHEIVFDGATVSDIEELDEYIPLYSGEQSQIPITDVEELVDILEDSISLLTEPLDALYEGIEPEEYDLLLKIIITQGVGRSERPVWNCFGSRCYKTICAVGIRLSLSIFFSV